MEMSQVRKYTITLEKTNTVKLDTMENTVCGSSSKCSNIVFLIVKHGGGSIIIGGGGSKDLRNWSKLKEEAKSQTIQMDTTSGPVTHDLYREPWKPVFQTVQYHVEVGPAGLRNWLEHAHQLAVNSLPGLVSANPGQ